jgi:pre-mRNA-splicing factor 38A
LLEKPVRERIVESYYWKESCFGVNEADIVDRVMETVTFVGGVVGSGAGGGKPSPFLCLAFKMLQLGMEEAIVRLMLEQEEFKFVLSNYLQFIMSRLLIKSSRNRYLRALAAFYVRLTFPPQDIYKTLEPYLSDYRKLKSKTRTVYTLTYMDQFIDDLLTKDRVCATSLWKMPSRQQLEDLDLLEERVSPLGDELGELDGSDVDMDEYDKEESDGELIDDGNGGKESLNGTADGSDSAE